MLCIQYLQTEFWKKSKKMVQAFLPLRNFPGCVWGSHHCLSRDHIAWPLTVCLLAHLPSGLCPLLEALLLPAIAAASFPLVILPYGRSGSCVGLRALGGQGSTLSFSVSPWIAATSLLALWALFLYRGTVFEAQFPTYVSPCIFPHEAKWEW